ncbi:hypothetical protein HK097_010659, partial [Rhizophlyctis rosea]
MLKQAIRYGSRPTKPSTSSRRSKKVCAIRVAVIAAADDVATGDRVLVHAGASGVGTAAIQLARLAKARTIIVTAGHERKLAFCKDLGATHGINYKTEKFVEKVPEYTTNAGVDVLVDCIGASYFNDNLSVLALDGRAVLLALMGGNLNFAYFAMLMVLVNGFGQIEGSTLRSRSLDYQIELRNAVVDNVLPYLEDGTLKPIIDREYNWDRIVEAHKHMESNESIGKGVGRCQIKIRVLAKTELFSDEMRDRALMAVVRRDVAVEYPLSMK